MHVVLLTRHHPGVAVARLQYLKYRKPHGLFFTQPIIAKKIHCEVYSFFSIACLHHLRRTQPIETSEKVLLFWVNTQLKYFKCRNKNTIKCKDLKSTQPIWRKKNKNMIPFFSFLLSCHYHHFSKTKFEQQKLFSLFPHDYSTLTSWWQSTVWGPDITLAWLLQELSGWLWVGSALLPV